MVTIENVMDKSIEVSVNRALAAFDKKIDSIKLGFLKYHKIRSYRRKNSVT